MRHTLHAHFAAVAALCAAGAANATVVYSGPVNLPIPANIDGLYLNVEDGTTGTTGGTTPGWDVNPYGATYLSFYAASGTGHMRHPLATTTGKTNLAADTVIGTAAYFYGSSAAVIGTLDGQWALGTEGIVGFKFTASDGLTHHGWMRILLGGALAERTLVDYAWESDAGVDILAGSGSGGGAPDYDPCNPSNPTLGNGANSKAYRTSTVADLSVCAGTVYAANYYMFTPTDSGSHTISSCDPSSAASLSVMSGCDAAASALACGTASCGSGSSATVDLTAGVPVYVVVGGSVPAGIAGATVAIQIDSPPIAACVAAADAVFGDNVFENTGTVLQKVKSSADGTASANIQKAVWYKFVPTVTGAYSVRTCGSSGDTMLAIGEVCPGAASRFESLAYNDDAPNCLSGTAGNLSSVVSIDNNGATGTFAGFPLTQDLVAGQAYYICAGSYSATATVTGILNIDGPPQQAPCDGDFNMDGLRDGADLGTLLAAWGTADADMNGDGVTDGADLGGFLAIFGLPCN